MTCSYTGANTPPGVFHYAHHHRCSSGRPRPHRLTAQEIEPASFSLTSPEYGAFLGDEDILVAGIASPPGTTVIINDQAVASGEDGTFSMTMPVDGPYRIVEVLAGDQRERVPVFSGHDPEDTWPGGISARLLPAGLTRIGTELGGVIDSTGWADLLGDSLPSVSGDGYSILPDGIVHDATVVVLEGTDGGVDTAISLRNVGIEYTIGVDVFGTTLEAPMSLIFGEIALGAVAVPALDSDGIITLELTDPSLVLDSPDVTISILEGWVLEWILELVSDWIIEPLTDLLLDFVLAEFGVLELGGPLAFETDLLGTALSMVLADIGGDYDGVRAGLAVGIGEPASETFTVAMPTAEEGDDSHAALGVHEGLIDVMLSSQLLGMLDQQLDLAGSFGDIIGAGVAQLPGGSDIPDGDGWCFSIDPGTATVARMQASVAPLAVLYIPDLVVEFGIQQGSSCEDWLVASLATEVQLNIEDGSALGIDLVVAEGAILYYGADDWNEDEVVAGLGDYVGTLIGFLGGAFSLDLADLLGGTELIPGLSPLSIEVTDSEPLLNEDGTWTEGLYRVSVDLWQ
ncbi:MAG: hypothetical protein ACI8S6_004226 [Myxococcota bacterium]